MNSNKFENQGEMLAARVKKRFKHLFKRYKKANIEVFRLYDWDIPEIRAVVDWYNGHLVIAEYTRKQSTPQWLPLMAKYVGEALSISSDKIHLKKRQTGYNSGKRYERLDNTEKKIKVKEDVFNFLVNPYDYLDTGLFSDHRNTRKMIMKEAKNKNFLNLFCYTGTFSCYAAKGGAKSTRSVDRSETAINWTRDNLELNKLNSVENKLYQMDTFTFLERAKKEKIKFDLVVVDPPSYYTYNYKKIKFDISKDHPKLLSEVIDLMSPNGIIYFSTNHQNFTPFFDDLKITKYEEITSKTIPEDYINHRKKIHRCWKIFI